MIAKKEQFREKFRKDEGVEETEEKALEEENVPGGCGDIERYCGFGGR